MILTFDLLTLNFYSTSGVMRLNSVQNLSEIHGWVIDDLARFRCAILGVGHDWHTVLRGAGTQLHQTGQGHRAIIPKQEVCFIMRISCCIFKRERLKVEWCWKRRQISHILTPSLVKIRGGVGEISIPTVEALPTTEPPDYIWWPSTARLLSAVDW